MWIYIVAPFAGGILAGLWRKFDNFAVKKLEENNNVSDNYDKPLAS